MKQFGDFDIKVEQPAFTGDKIKVKKILNKSIVVHDYKVEKSKFEGKGDCLYLQVEVDGNKHVVFTSGVGLIEQIRKVPKEGFPFMATIVENNERFEFV